MTKSQTAESTRPAVIPSQPNANARLARLGRYGGSEAEKTEARQDFAAARIATFIERTLAAAPPIGDERAEALAAMLRDHS